MDIRFETDRGWERLAEGVDVFRRAVRRGLQRAGVQALAEIKANFEAGGRPGRWASYTVPYRLRKTAGIAVPGGQLSTSAIPNLILTGALIRASVQVPSHQLFPSSLVLWPNPSIQLGGRSPVGKYANPVEALRPYYMVPAGEPMRRVAAAFSEGFLNVINDTKDAEGESLT